MADTSKGFHLETERLILRDWREEDWQPFWDCTNTPEVMQWLGGVMPDDKLQWVRDRLEGYSRDHGFTFWVVERKADGGHLSGELLGFCGLKMSNQTGGPLGEHEAGWRLREDAWGKGYALEAAKATLAIGFQEHHAPHILALTVQENRPSWGLMERLGMARREDLDFDSKEFGSESVIVYSIDRANWSSRNG